MSTPLIEAGSLRIFRLFAGLQLGVLLFTALIFLGHIHPAGYHSPGEVVLMLASSAALFGYLLAPAPRRWLGELYLPLAIGLSLCAPLLGRVLVAGENLPFAQYLGVTGEMELFTLFPVLVAGWRYRFRVVALLVAASGLVELVVTRVAYPVESGDVEYGRLAFARTLGYLAIGYILTRLMRAQREQHEALRQANARLAHYAATLSGLAESRERARLARELHDTLAHTLSGLAVQLEGIRSVWEADPARARELLGKSLAGTRAGLVETRRALGALRAAPLEELGLCAALRDRAEAAGRRGGLAVTVDLPDALPGVPPDVEQGFYRVAQEALENVVNHAGAEHVWVRLAVEDGRLELTVRDDGCGFDAGAGLDTGAGLDALDRAGPVDGGHLGLRGLVERARLIGARLELRSAPGAGTTVALAIELDRPDAVAVATEGEATAVGMGTAAGMGTAVGEIEP